MKYNDAFIKLKGASHDVRIMPNSLNVTDLRTAKMKRLKNESFIFQPGLLDQEQRFFGKYVEENRAAQLIKKKRKKGKGN